MYEILNKIHELIAPNGLLRNVHVSAVKIVTLIDNEKDKAVLDKLVYIRDSVTPEDLPEYLHHQIKVLKKELKG